MSSWVIEGSDDGLDWREIDRREDDKNLCKSFVTTSFEIRCCDQMYKMLRVRQIGPSWSQFSFGKQKFVLRLSTLEFFGSIEL